MVASAVIRGSASFSDEAIYEIPDVIEPGDPVVVERNHPHANTIKRRTYPVSGDRSGFGIVSLSVPST
jgi:hypothetical protein